MRRTGRTLVTVDVQDVNSATRRPWLDYGASHSAAEMVAALRFAPSVEFVTSASLDYLRGTQRRFDFVFLDGDHGAATVYKEVPAVLGALNPGGVVLLHDYFPGGRPLWKGEPAIPGPYLAIKRLQAEGLPVEAVPLGALPWPTKLGSTTTTLALLLRR